MRTDISGSTRLHRSSLVSHRCEAYPVPLGLPNEATGSGSGTRSCQQSCELPLDVSRAKYCVPGGSQHDGGIAVQQVRPTEGHRGIEQSAQG